LNGSGLDSLFGGLRGDRVHGDPDVEMTCAIENVERSDDQGPARRDERGAFDHRLANDRVLRSDSRFFLDRAAALYLCTEAQTVLDLIEGDLEVHSKVDIGDGGCS
jgi:hypothetical protein